MLLELMRIPLLNTCFEESPIAVVCHNGRASNYFRLKLNLVPREVYFLLVGKSIRFLS